MQIDETQIGLVQSCFGCDGQTASHIASRAHKRRYAARAPIILAGDQSQDAWLLLEGAAQAVAYTQNGHQVLVHGFLPGDLFGEAAGLVPRAADLEVSATRASTAGQFPRLEFLALMENHGCVALAVARQLTLRLNETTRRMVEVATLSVTGRIHAELLRRAKASANMTIRPAPVLSELAQQVQSTRETVSRTISQLERRGLISRSETELKIIAPHRLEDLVF